MRAKAAANPALIPGQRKQLHTISNTASNKGQQKMKITQADIITDTCPFCKQIADLYPMRLVSSTNINLNVLLTEEGDPISIAEIMVLFKIRKVATGWQCVKCEKVSVQCPNCKKIQRVQPIDYDLKICMSCDKRYYAII